MPAALLLNLRSTTPGVSGPAAGMRRPVSPAGFGARQKKWIEPIIALEPMDYWRRIETAISIADAREAPKTHKYEGGGAIGKIRPNGFSAPILRTEPIAPIRVPDMVPSNRYTIEGIFANDITTDELIKVEDEMFLNDQIDSNIEYDLEVKHRFTHKAEGSVKLGGESSAEYYDYIAELIAKEDEMFILGNILDSDTDDEELKLLGVF